MSTKASSNGPMSIGAPETVPAGHQPGGLMPIPSFGGLKLLDPQETRLKVADRLKRCVPLRQHNYRHLASVIRTAQQQGRTLDDLYGAWAQNAHVDVESALLLRDLWEVLRLTEGRISQAQVEESRRHIYLVAELMRQRFSGEEVLF